MRDVSKRLDSLLTSQTKLLLTQTKSMQNVIQQVNTSREKFGIIYL